MVHLGVKETIEQMHGARPAGGETDSYLASEFRVRARHERGHFFVADLNVIHLLSGASDCADDAVDAVAGESVNAPDAPLVQTLDQEVTDSYIHSLSFISSVGRRSGVGSILNLLSGNDPQNLG